MESRLQAGTEVKLLADLGLDPAHFLGFSIATLLLLKYAKKRQAGPRWGGDDNVIVFSLLSTAIASECMQYFTSHREPLVIDGLSNLLAVGSGALLFWAYLRLKRVASS